jgi:hypothetical protein
MARTNDKRNIWIVSPIKSDDGEIRITGYTRLRKINIHCVPATGYIDYKTYGEKINRIYKFSSNAPIDIDYDGGDGIYFDEPQVDEKDGLYKNPPYISKPLTHFGKQYIFEAEKQV